MYSKFNVKVLLLCANSVEITSLENIYVIYVNNLFIDLVQESPSEMEEERTSFGASRNVPRFQLSLPIGTAQYL